MPNLEVQPGWPAARQLDRDEFASGGPNGNLNEHAKVFLARTEYLQQQKANKSEIVQGVFEFGTYAEFNAAKASLPLNCTVIINEVNNTGTSWRQGSNRWNGTTLTKSAYDPLTQAKVYTDERFLTLNDFASFISNENYDLAISGNGQVSFFIKDGKLYAALLDANSGNIKNITSTNIETTNAKIAGFELIKDNDPVFALKLANTETGEVAWGLKHDGSMSANNLEVMNINAESVTARQATGKYYPYKYQHNFILSEGQSLGKGIASGSVISSTQKYNDLMFVGGISTISPVFTQAAGQYASLVPMIQSYAEPTTASPYFLDGKAGEVPVQASTEIVHQLIELENGVGLNDYKFLGATNAAGNQSITTLSSESHFTNYVNPCFKNAYSRSVELNKTVGLSAFFWTQGHANISTDSPLYLQLLKALRVKYDALAKSTFGQIEDVKCIAYQHSDTPLTNKVSNAMFELASDTSQLFFVSCPAYHLGRASDAVHLTSRDYKILGGYYGITYKRVCVDGDLNWKPLYPVRFFKQGKTVQIKFNVLKGKLVLDNSNTLVPSVSNYGFYVYNQDGTEKTITSVSLIANDTVAITCDSDIATGSIVHYALNPSNSSGTIAGRAYRTGGNLRDDQGESIKFDVGVVGTPDLYPMHNWCLAFSKTL